jgi:hypothetical protein
LNSGIALGLVQAVSAGLVESAKGIGVKAGDVVLAAKGVVLEDLIRGIEGTTTDNTESDALLVCDFKRRGVILLSVQALGGQSILTDIFPPNYTRISMYILNIARNVPFSTQASPRA